MNMLNSMILIFHVIAAVSLWLASAYGLISLLQMNTSAVNIAKQFFIPLILACILSGVGLGLVSGASLVMVCAKIGLYIVPPLLTYALLVGAASKLDCTNGDEPNE